MLSAIATTIYGTSGSNMKMISLAIQSSGQNKALVQFSNVYRNKTEPLISPRDIRIVTLERFNKLGTKKCLTGFTKYLESGIF
jgi:hypothetical protein